MRAEPQQHISQVRLGVDAVGLARGDERREPREVLASLVAADEEVVLAAQGHRPQGPRGGVVVERQRGVLEEA